VIIIQYAGAATLMKGAHGCSVMAELKLAIAGTPFSTAANAGRSTENPQGRSGTPH
jgi:hypothetical protein